MRTSPPASTASVLTLICSSGLLIQVDGRKRLGPTPPPPSLHPLPSPRGVLEQVEGRGRGGNMAPALLLQKFSNVSTQP